MAAQLRAVMRSATPYMRSRHDQKSSSPASRRSARPAIARWKAWLCASTRLGSTGPVSACAPRAAATPGVTSDQSPGRRASSTASRQAPPIQTRGAR